METTSRSPIKFGQLSLCANGCLLRILEAQSFSMTDQVRYPKHAENIDSQVIVDFSEAFAAHPEWRISNTTDALTPEDAPGEFSEKYPTSYWKDSYRRVLDEECDDEVYDDYHIDTKLTAKYMERDHLLREHPTTRLSPTGELGEDHLILLPDRVFAFVMKNRNWGKPILSLR